MSFLDCYAIPDGGDDYIFAIECLLEFFTDLGVEYKREGKVQEPCMHTHVCGQGGWTGAGMCMWECNESFPFTW